MIGYLLSGEAIGRKRKNDTGSIQVVREIHLEIAQAIPNPAKGHVGVHASAQGEAAFPLLWCLIAPSVWHHLRLQIAATAPIQ
jgi:hypothetical protein